MVYEGAQNNRKIYITNKNEFIITVMNTNQATINLQK